MKTILKRVPILFLVLLLALVSASYAEPATEVKAPADAPVVEPVVEKEAPADAPAVEPADEAATPVDAPVVEPVDEGATPVDAPVVELADEAATPVDAPVVEPTAVAETPAVSSTESERISDVAIVPIDKEKPPQQEYHYLSGTPLFAFWEENDCIIHADPDCMKIPDDTPFTGYSWGTLREAVVAGHTEWCPKCSPMKTVEQEWFGENLDVQDDEKFLEKYGNFWLREDGNTIAGGLVEVDGKWFFRDPWDEWLANNP